MPFVFESPNTMLKFFFFLFLKRKTMCIIKVDYVNQHEAATTSGGTSSI